MAIILVTLNCNTHCYYRVHAESNLTSSDFRLSVFGLVNCSFSSPVVAVVLPLLGSGFWLFNAATIYNGINEFRPSYVPTNTYIHVFIIHASHNSGP